MKLLKGKRLKLCTSVADNLSLCPIVFKVLGTRMGKFLTKAIHFILLGLECGVSLEKSNSQHQFFIIRKKVFGKVGSLGLCLFELL